MKESLLRAKKLQDIVVGLEMQINVFEQDLNIIEHNLTTLYKAEKDLVFNINFLKKEKIVAVAVEYKRSINDLANVRKKISELVSNKNKVKKDLNKKLKNFEKYMQEWKYAKKQLDNEKVVLIFDPSKKRKHEE